MASTCFVTAQDYSIHFEGKGAKREPIWNGTERRLDTVDRRHVGHERRWDTSRGRRFRVGDRRA